jgi:hypothetical protein
MKPVYSKVRRCIFLALLVCFSFYGKLLAQTNLDELIKAGPSDGGKLVKAYISPVLRGFGSALNSSWYNTAAPHKLGGFDLTITLNGAIVPGAEKTYNVNDLGLQVFRMQAGENPDAQTISGSEEDGPEMNIIVEGNSGNDSIVGSVIIPGGSGIGYSGTPMVQIGVGLIKKTELMIRFVPAFNLPNDLGSIGLLGFGIKHDIKQWIPVVSELPFDLSAYFAYTGFNYKIPIDFQPEPNTVQPGGNPPPDYSGQEMKMKTSATTFGLVVSKKIAVLTLYGGLGYNSSKTTVDLKGVYPIALEVNSDGEREITNYTDPVSFDVKGANGVKADLGFRLKFGLFAFHADYMLSKYPVVSAGIGINFR